jgi:UTP--glucose-1-phosphate uridylyltransferase
MRSSKGSDYLPEFIAKMKSEDLPEVVIASFAHYYRQIINGGTGLLHEQEIQPVNQKEIVDIKDLSPYIPQGSIALEKTIMIKLNGGLGTSMGLKSAKSLLPVKDGRNFLEIITQQAEMYGVVLAFMNSFNTHRDTSEALDRIQPKQCTHQFLQHKFPKVLQKDLAPVVWKPNPDLEWNPPGHGDIFLALKTSGMLQKLLDEKIVYAFISNSDNLGATMDLPLLGYFAISALPFMMEVTDRTPNDRKGGHLALRLDGRLLLRELAQCPEEEIDAFTDIDRYSLFNTNNIWINLKFLKEHLDTHKQIRLPLILNSKTLDPRDDTSPPVYQVETAMGSAISLFEDATVVYVPRSRFFPVKTTEDLMAVRSDCFEFSPEQKLTANPGRTEDLPLICLDPRYYGKIDEFNQRFPSIPSLRKCASLDIEGDVRFEPQVTLKGHVKIKNTVPSQAVIPKNSLLEGNITC